MAEQMALPALDAHSLDHAVFARMEPSGWWRVICKTCGATWPSAAKVEDAVKQYREG